MRRSLRLVAAVFLVVWPGCGGTEHPAGPSSPVEPLALKGIVRESGTQAPLPNARVCWFYPNCVSTEPDGSYRIAHSGPQGNCAYVDAPDFEGRQDCVQLTGRETTWNPTIQRTIRVEAGQAVTVTIFPDDISGLQLEDYCVLCKRVRVLAVRAGRLTVRLTPEGAGLRLAFAYAGQRANEPFQVMAGQEYPVTILTDNPSAPRSFVLSTDFVAD